MILSSVTLVCCGEAPPLGASRLLALSLIGVKLRVGARVCVGGLRLLVQRTAPGTASAALRVTTDTRILVVGEDTPAASPAIALNLAASGLVQERTAKDAAVAASASTGSSAGCSAHIPLAYWLALAGGAKAPVAGLDGPLSALLEELCLPRVPSAAAAVVALSLRPAGGLLLHGLPGTGKTHLVRAAASLAARALPGVEVRVWAVNGGSLLHDPSGPDAALAAIFAQAKAHARAPGGATDGREDDESMHINDSALDEELAALRSAVGDSCAGDASSTGSSDRRRGGLAIVFFDEVDALCPTEASPHGSNNGSAGGAAARLRAQLITEMDALVSAPTSIGDGEVARVLVVAATNRPDAVDSALRRPGRFNRELRVDLPAAAARADILLLHLRDVPLSADARASVPALAAACVGFAGADLAALAATAARAAAGRRARSLNGGDEPVTAADLERARGAMTAASLRGVQVAVEPTPWAAVGGMDAVIARLRAAVELPMTHSAAFAALRVAPPRGVLLHGPPGCAKTTLVRALATAVHAAFFALSGAEIISAFVGEAERTLRDLFARARAAAPAIIFLDEIDALVGSRGIGGTASEGEGA